MIINNITSLTLENTDFRRVISTNDHAQLVLMNIPVREEIGEEVHQNNDQILIIVQGEAEAILNGEKGTVKESGIIIVPCGTKHNIRNVGDVALKLYTVYAPSEHPDKTVHKTKAEADAAEREEHHDMS